MNDDGNTYKNDRSREGKQVYWSADSSGQVYTVFEDIRSLIGWVDEKGRVYDAFAKPYGYARISRSGGYFSIRGFHPGLVFKVTKEGAIYGRGLFRTKLVGQVEGTSDLRRIGELALLFLRWYAAFS